MTQMPDYLVARDKKNNEKYYVCVIRSRWTSSQFWTTNQSHHVPLMPPLFRAGATILSDHAHFSSIEGDDLGFCISHYADQVCAVMFTPD